MRKYLKSLMLTALVLFVAAPSAFAQHFQTMGKDSPFRWGHERIVCSQAQATTGTLVSTDDTIVNGFSIASADTTSVPAADVAKIRGGPRTLLVMVNENSGTGLKGTVTITGWSPLCPRQVTEVLTFSGGDEFAVTNYAYIGEITVKLSLTGNAASDTLHIGPYGFGFPLHTSAILGVTFYDESGSSFADDTGTWDSTFRTYVPSSTLAIEDELEVFTFQDLSTAPNCGAQAVAADSDI